MGNYKHKNTEKKERNDRFLWELFWPARGRICLQTICNVKTVPRPRVWEGKGEDV